MPTVNADSKLQIQRSAFCDNVHGMELVYRSGLVEIVKSNLKEFLFDSQKSHDFASSDILFSYTAISS